MLREIGMNKKGQPATGAGARLRWYYEVTAILVFYVVYSFVRNSFGSATVDPELALQNAVRVIDAERAMGLFFEPQMQSAFLGWNWFLRLWNIYYGSLHFIVTGAVMIVLFRRYPSRYRVMRNALGITTALALLGFSLFPLMPPRLLNDFGIYGGRDPTFDFVDTLAQVGGLWSFDSGTMQSVSNQYAAMPSLHIGWSLWCTVAIWPLLRSRWSRRLFAIYPLVTLFAIVVTANHFWLDAVGGVIVFLVGWQVALRFEPLAGRLRSRQLAGRGGAAQPDGQQAARDQPDDDRPGDDQFGPRPCTV